MNYPPKHHQEINKNALIQVIKTYPLATIISVNQSEPVITHVPLIYEHHELIGHIDAQNPHSKLLQNNNKIVVIFSGPQCYISPSIYKSNQLPTWNYIKVHATGVVCAITDPKEIKQNMVKMTAFLEQPKQAYRLDSQDSRMEKYIPHIFGFKISITNWDGKFKVSQNRSLEDFELAKAEMVKRNQESIGDFLNLIIQK